MTMDGDYITHTHTHTHSISCQLPWTHIGAYIRNLALGTKYATA